MGRVVVSSPDKKWLRCLQKYGVKACSVADGGGGMSAGSTAGPIARSRGQRMAAWCAAALLAHANQLPLARL